SRNRNGVEVVVHPQRIPGSRIGVLREVAHHLPMPLYGNADKIQPPALRNKQSKAHVMRLYAPVEIRTRTVPVRTSHRCALGPCRRRTRPADRADLVSVSARWRTVDTHWRAVPEGAFHRGGRPLFVDGRPRGAHRALCRGRRAGQSHRTGHRRAVGRDDAALYAAGTSGCISRVRPRRARRPSGHLHEAAALGVRRHGLGALATVDVMSSRHLVFKVFYRLGFTPWDGHEIATSLRSLVERDGLAPGKALDVGCGTGDTSIYLAQHGWQVTGIDFVPQAVEKARAKASAKSVIVDFRQGDA